MKIAGSVYGSDEVHSYAVSTYHSSLFSSAVQQGGNGEGIKRQLAEREREVKGLQVQLDTAKKEVLFKA